MSKLCSGCRDGRDFGLPFSMAFQPIVDISSGAIFAHEALVRGANGEEAHSVLSSVNETNRYAFDQQCRVKAIEMATALGVAKNGACLSINFIPNAIYEPLACIRPTLAAARRTGFPLDRIIFEFTEAQKLDAAHIRNIVRTYKEIGFKTAIDDFGAGQAGLLLLAQFQPDIVKIDIELIRGIDANPIKRSILTHVLALLEEISILPICEGVETWAELEVLEDLGVRMIQGFLLAKPAFESLATPAHVPNPRARPSHALTSGLARCVVLSDGVQRRCAMNPAESVEERIRQRAHQIWEDEGRPDGREHEHWERAAREIQAEAGTGESETPKTRAAEPKLPPLPTD